MQHKIKNFFFPPNFDEQEWQLSFIRKIEFCRKSYIFQYCSISAAGGRNINYSLQFFDGIVLNGAERLVPD